MKSSKIAIFASGSGSNAENIINYSQSTPGCQLEVTLVVCNRPGARVIDRARRLGVPVKVMTRSEINDPAVMLPTLQEANVDAIALAGFLLMIPDFLLERYQGRIINIHPSLLPKYGGKGMYGHHIHQAVVAAGETETGITIHHVSSECDGGDIIFQAAIPIAPDSTPADVETAIHSLERTHYPRVLAATLSASSKQNPPYDRNLTRQSPKYNSTLNRMKVIGINGSARKDGNTAIIIGKVFDELNKEGIATELIQLADYDIRPCRGCFACRGRGNCMFTIDGFAEIFNRLVECDGVILGSPVYSADVSAKMKAFLERGGVVVATNPGLLRHKIGASVAAVRRGGGMTTVDTMNHFMLNKEMIVVGSTYWNMVYGKDAADVLNDEEGIANMQNLGENMAWLLKQIENNAKPS